MNPLTAKQKAIFGYVVKCIGNGKPPTVREIGEEFGIRSPNGVMCHLRALEKKGYITRDRKSRGIGLIAPRFEAVVRLAAIAGQDEVLWTKIDEGIPDAPSSVLLWLDTILKDERESE